MGRGPLGHRPWSGPRAVNWAVNWAAGRGPPGRGPAFSKTPRTCTSTCTKKLSVSFLVHNSVI